MKKLLALFAFIFVLTTAAYAEIKQEQGYISVNVEASEDYNPTLVKLSFAIETRDKDPEITANLNKQQSEKAINAVKTLIDTTKNETIKTTSYYFNPEYTYKDGKKLTGYVAVNTLQIAIKDPDKTGKIISTALSNGATSVSGLEFILEETNDNCNLLMQKAAQGAFHGIVDYTELPLVSVDFNHDPHSAIVDGTQTRVSGAHLIKTLVWCDNEWGFANRMLDTTLAMATVAFR